MYQKNISADSKINASLSETLKRPPSSELGRGLLAVNLNSSTWSRIGRKPAGTGSSCWNLSDNLQALGKHVRGFVLNESLLGSFLVFLWTPAFHSSICSLAAEGRGGRHEGSSGLKGTENKEAGGGPELACHQSLFDYWPFQSFIQSSFGVGAVRTILLYLQSCNGNEEDSSASFREGELL